MGRSTPSTLDQSPPRTGDEPEPSVPPTEGRPARARRRGHTRPPAAPNPASVTAGGTPAPPDVGDQADPIHQAPLLSPEPAAHDPEVFDTSHESHEPDDTIGYTVSDMPPEPPRLSRSEARSEARADRGGRGGYPRPPVTS